MPIAKSKPVLTSFRMKKWSGGMLIMVLAFVLVIRYSAVPTQPEKLADHPVVNSKVEAKSVRKPVKKPHFLNFEGLDYLFSDKNISIVESKPLLVWSSMLPVLARSDALPETAQGIKEAALAWKDLVFLINDDKRSSMFNDTESEESGKCVASVKAFDGDLSGGRPALELPCGLVEDSSITVVGIPDERSRSFQVQLVGAKLSSEMKPPIILNYNVSLSGDNETEKPSIVQNTWTEQQGWGKEERCPGHGPSKDQKVDELLLCNEHSVRSTLEESQDSSHPNSDIAVNVSRRTTNFPFLRGNPFTATIWVGSEGFHMTVNGQHETSFAYREKLEPWSVSAVKISGGLNLLSALATGLPIPDNHGLIKDEKLKAPSLSSKRLLLLVGVFSTGNNFKRRMALRRSWMQYEAVRSGKVAVRFLVGLHTNAEVNFEMWREAQAYGDIQFMPFVDYYGLISLKTIALCILGTKIIPAKYIMKTDDDAFVRIDELLSGLQEKPSNALLYGLVSFDASPNREEDSKWYISKEQWPHNTYPPWAHGPGYIISSDIAKFVVKGHRKKYLRLFKLEDVAMGIWIHQYNQTGQVVNYVNDERFHNAGCESNYILAHYQGPRLVLCLWEKLQKEKQPVCCE